MKYLIIVLALTSCAAQPPDVFLEACDDMCSKDGMVFGGIVKAGECYCVDPN